MYRLETKVQNDHEDRVAQANCTEVLAQRRLDRSQVTLAAIHLEMTKEVNPRTVLTNKFMAEHKVRMHYLDILDKRKYT
jgi:hypothetical protein